MKKYLFIDDDRTLDMVDLSFHPQDFAENCFIARDYHSAIKYLITCGVPEYISFDHDIGNHRDDEGRELNALQVAKWIIERDMDMMYTFIPSKFDFRVHSANPIGADNIESILINYLAFRKREIENIIYNSQQ